MLDVMRKDGWNFDGALNKYGRPCTGNCAIYGDNGPVPYTPVNNPFAPPTSPERYSPLVETNGKGFSFSQAHVTPHIGRAPFQILTTPRFSQEEIDARTIDNPMYDLQAGGAAAIEEVRITGKSDYRKTVIEFMNNKINLAGGLIMRLREAYKLSLEQQLMYHVGYTTVEHDSIILTWREKIRFDLVRPTTVVQGMGDMEINSFKRPNEGTGKMSALDWNPYIRTMPHSEYPSGSGCICTVVSEYVDAFVDDQYGIPSFKTSWKFAPGSSKVEPGTTPAKEIVLEFDNMSQLRDLCGESRIWGGMHFQASVPASYQLCEGIGARAYLNCSRSLLPGPVGTLFDDAEVYDPSA
eukprot:gene5034-34821_t